MIKELQERFDIWYEEEGKDMLPIKESLEVAWSNGAYIIQNRTCESCKYWFQAITRDELFNNTTTPTCFMMVMSDDNYISTPDKDFCCNKYEAKDK